MSLNLKSVSPFALFHWQFHCILFFYGLQDIFCFVCRWHFDSFCIVSKVTIITTPHIFNTICFFRISFIFISWTNCRFVAAWSFAAQLVGARPIRIDDRRWPISFDFPYKNCAFFAFSCAGPIFYFQMIFACHFPISISSSFCYDVIELIFSDNTMIALDRICDKT